MEVCKAWAHVYTKGKKAPQELSNCVFDPKADEPNSKVTLSLKAASKGSNHSPCTNMPLKCTFCNDGR